MPPNLVGPRTVWVKTDTGQIQVVTLPPPPQASGSITGPGIRLQSGSGQSLTAVQASGQAGAAATTGTIRTQLAPGGTQIVVPVSLSTIQQQQQQIAVAAGKQQQGPVTSIMSPLIQQQHQQSLPANQPLTIQTTTANVAAASAAPSQMSPTTAKKKCKNFLSTLIRLASDQPDNVASNVKTLIQGLIVCIQ